MTQPTKARALRFAKDAQRMLDNAETKATEQAKRRDEALAAAQQTGATYREIQDATGLSTTRVTQILRRHRNA